MKAPQLVNIHKLATALRNRHRNISDTGTRVREKAVARQNEETHVRSPNLGVGDYVLVAHRIRGYSPNLRVKWKGPRRSSRVISEFIYEVEDLISQSCHLVHANRLKLYAYSSLNVREELIETIAHNETHLRKGLIDPVHQSPQFLVVHEYSRINVEPKRSLRMESLTGEREAEKKA